MFSVTKHKYKSPLLEKSAKGKIKDFEKNHCTRLLLLNTEQNNIYSLYILLYSHRHLTACR
jgi:hypothetical protein